MIKIAITCVEQVYLDTVVDISRHHHHHYQTSAPFKDQPLTFHVLEEHRKPWMTNWNGVSSSSILI